MKCGLIYCGSIRGAALLLSGAGRWLASGPRLGAIADTVLCPWGGGIPRALNAFAITPVDAAEYERAVLDGGVLVAVHLRSAAARVRPPAPCSRFVSPGARGRDAARADGRSGVAFPRRRERPVRRGVVADGIESRLSRCPRFLYGGAVRRRFARIRDVAQKVPFIVAFPIAVAALVTSRDVRAEVRWVAPVGCSSESKLVEAVARTLGRSEPETRTIEARAVVEAVPDGYRVRVDVAGGERTIEAKTCDEVLEATALVVALAIDPNARPSQALPSSRPRTAPAPVASPTPTPVPPRGSPAPARPNERDSARSDTDRKSTRLNSSHSTLSRMPSSA